MGSAASALISITNQILINFISASKINIILKSDIKKERNFNVLYIIFSFKISGIVWDCIEFKRGSDSSASLSHLKFVQKK